LEIPTAHCARQDIATCHAGSHKVQDPRIKMASKHLDALLLDGSTTVQQKIDCVSTVGMCSDLYFLFLGSRSSPSLVCTLCLQLKLLKVVTKNLSDPAKSSDPKYRQLKLDNATVRTKILACPSAVPLLQSLSFVETLESDIQVLRVEEHLVNHAAMTAMMNDITSTLSMLDGQANLQNKKPKHDPGNTVATSATTDKLSEKQKARMLLEEKQEKERELAREHRKKNVALLKQDKYVRQNDENWTSGVSAACAKSGDSISTFRDKYGEH
jgi:PUB domain